MGTDAHEGVDTFVDAFLPAESCGLEIRDRPAVDFEVNIFNHFVSQTAPETYYSHLALLNCIKGSPAAVRQFA